MFVVSGATGTRFGSFRVICIESEASTYDVGVLGTKIAVDANAMQFKTLRKDEIVDGNHGFSWKIRRRLL